MTSMIESRKVTQAYRADIDGLRAIAVLAVILFHINKKIIPGGFVGVDVFFVISGFLITTHLLKDLGENNFSFLQFYSRRIKRIAPAMLVVVGVTLVAAQYLLLPEDAKAAAKSGVWSLASMANFYFWLFQDSSYFAVSSSELPLLHLWSLGVEEQFYLIWPFLAWCAYARNARTLLIIMTFVAFASFGLAEFIFKIDPSFAYYMLPARIGEFFVGAITAMLVFSSFHERVSAKFAVPLTLVGALLLCGSMLFLSEDKIFPGILAIPPVVGTALIIFGGTVRFNSVSGLLSVNALTGIGAISYSAYLWHWPLLAFFRYGYGEPGVLSATLIFTLTLTLAWLTYRYVEQPGRKISATRWRYIFSAFCSSSLMLFAIALFFVYSDRLPSAYRATEYDRTLAEVRGMETSTGELSNVCQRNQLNESDRANPECEIGSGSNNAKDVLLIGDSNAAHYVGMVEAFAVKSGFRFLNLEVGSCPPLTSDITPYVIVKRQAACTASQKIWRAALLDAKIVILGGTWTEYQNKSSLFLPTLFKQVQQLEADGKTVILMGKVAVIDGFDRLCAEKALRYPQLNCTAASNPLSTEIIDVNAQLRQFAADSRAVRYFDVNGYLCPEGVCSAYGKDGNSLYFDKWHLSNSGSRRVGDAIYAAEGLPQAFRNQIFLKENKR